MADDHRLTELLLQWEELQEQGKPAAVEELCRDCPELAEELRRRVRVLQAIPRTLPVSPGPGTGSTASDGGPPPAAPSGLPAVPGYEVLGVLGRGGMGVVYRARQVALDRPVALKMILAGPSATAQQMQRFRAEAEVIARLQHPNVIQVFDVGAVGGRPYCALELVEGGSLADRLDGTPWKPPAAAGLVAALADGVQAAHARGIVHRDLKPGNVLLTRDGRPKVTDFGLAKRLDETLGLTQTGMVLGTPQYMAPEQATGRAGSAGPAADIYALGVLLYELLTGRPPFHGPTTLETLRRVQGQEPVPPRRLEPEVSRDLETVCLRCLHKEPGKRYATAAELAADLRRFLAGEPVRARPAGPVGRTLRWARRRPGVAALAAALLLALVGGCLGMFLLWRQAEDHGRRAEEARDDADRQRHLAVANEARARLEKAEAEQVQGEARREKAQAEANFRLARKAVDDFTARLGEGEDEPGENLRRNLLRTSLAFYRQLVNQRGGDPELRAAQGRAYLNLARLSAELGAAEAEAFKHYSQAEAVFKQLLAQDPGNARYQHDLSRVYYHLGRACAELNQPVRADQYLAKARDLLQRLRDAEPGNRAYGRELAHAWYALGRACFARSCGRVHVETAYRKALALLDELEGKRALAPADQALRGEVHAGLGTLYRSHGEHKPAEAEYRRALAVQQGLAARHPSVVKYQGDLADTWFGLGVLQLLEGQRLEGEAGRKRHQEGWDSLTRARVLRERLAAGHPGVARLAAELGTTYEVLGSWVLGNRPPADKARLVWFSKAVGVLEPVVAKEPRHGLARAALCRAYIGRARSQDGLGQHDEAMKDWKRLESFPETQSLVRVRLPYALTLAHLGRHADAAAKVADLDDGRLGAGAVLQLARVYAACARAVRADKGLAAAARDKLAEAHEARAVALLARVQASSSQKGGLRQSVLREPTFEALRGRADFQKVFRKGK
jgi:serine/threonine-protein kinase